MVASVLSEPLLGPRASWSSCTGGTSGSANANAATLHSQECPATPGDVNNPSVGLTLRAVLAGKRAAARHYNAGSLSSSESIAAASVILSLELVRICKALTHHKHLVRAHEHSMMSIGRAEREAAQSLEDLFVELRENVLQMQEYAAERMLVYGILGKQGHRRRSLKLRMFLLEGSNVTYYKLNGGTLTPKGSFPLGQVVNVTRVESPEDRGCKTARAAVRTLATIGVNRTSSDAMAPDVVHRDFTLQVDLAPPSKLYPGRRWHQSYTVFAPDAASRDVWENTLRPRMQGTLMCCKSIWLSCPTQWDPVHAVLHKSQIALCRLSAKTKASLDRLNQLKLMKEETAATLGTASAKHGHLVRKIQREMRELSDVDRGTHKPVSLLLSEVVGISKQHVKIPENVAEDGVPQEFEMITVVLKNGTLYLRAGSDGEEASGAERINEWFVATQQLLQRLRTTECCTQRQ